jgi:hypothetical protein
MSEISASKEGRKEMSNHAENWMALITYLQFNFQQNLITNTVGKVLKSAIIGENVIS